MKVRFLILAAGLFVLGCGDDYYPPGLYGYQVERLLASDTFKTWNLNRFEVDGKAQEIKATTPLQVLLITYQDEGNLSFDSVRIDDLTGTDTLFVGTADASSFDLIFTDSLIFSSGDFWDVRTVTSLRFTFQRTESGEKVVRSYSLP